MYPGKRTDSHPLLTAKISRFLSSSSLSGGGGELDVPPGMGMIIAGTNVKADSGRFLSRRLDPFRRNYEPPPSSEKQEEEEEEKRIYLSWTRGDGV